MPQRDFEASFLRGIPAVSPKRPQTQPFRSFEKKVFLPNIIMDASSLAAPHINENFQRAKSSQGHSRSRGRASTPIHCVEITFNVPRSTPHKQKQRVRSKKEKMRTEENTLVPVASSSHCRPLSAINDGLDDVRVLCGLKASDGFISPPAPQNTDEARVRAGNSMALFPPATPETSCFAVATAAVPRKFQSIAPTNLASIETLIRNSEAGGRRPINVADGGFPFRVKKIYGIKEKSKTKVTSQSSSNELWTKKGERLAKMRHIRESRIPPSRINKSKHRSPCTLKIEA